MSFRTRVCPTRVRICGSHLVKLVFCGGMVVYPADQASCCIWSIVVVSLCAPGTVSMMANSGRPSQIILRNRLNRCLGSLCPR